MKKIVFKSYTFEDYINAYHDGECKQCKSKMFMFRGKDGPFFRCSKRTCNGRLRLNKNDFIKFLRLKKHFLDHERSKDSFSEQLTGLMQCYPDWNPDEMDIDTYREINGLD